MRVRQGQDTLWDLFLFVVDQTFRVLFKKNLHFYGRRKVHQYSNVIEDDAYHIRDAKLPLLDKDDECVFFAYVFEDTFYSYLYLDDCYNEETVDYCDNFLYEGLYGLQNNFVDVTVKPGDVVIDAGSWIGDFAAYASAKGAKVYAFEPIEKNFKYLSQTAMLNPNIVPLQKGLSSESSNKQIFLDECNTGASSFIKDMCFRGKKSSSPVVTTTLDAFVKEQKLDKVDFIKSDIEGYERYMLMGAQETLRRFAPKLALCIYHLPDDPAVMSALIRQANPAYNIVLKSKKLYASVPAYTIRAAS